MEFQRPKAYKYKAETCIESLNDYVLYLQCILTLMERTAVVELRANYVPDYRSGGRFCNACLPCP